MSTRSPTPCSRCSRRSRHERRRVCVELGDRSYDVVIEDGYDALRDVVRGRRRVALVTQAEVGRHVGPFVGAALSAGGSRRTSAS